MTKPLYRGHDFVVPAGGGRTINTHASYVRCISSTGKVRIGINGEPSGSFEAGLGITADPGETFTELRFENEGDSDVHVEIGVGRGTMQDSRFVLSGSIRVGAGGVSFEETEIDVGITSVELLPANADRTSATITAGDEDIYIGHDSGVSVETIPSIPAGGTRTIGHRGAVWAIAGAAAKVRVNEESA